MSTLRVNTLQNAAGTGQPAMSGAAKAWVNFNGTGTVAIRAAFNVSSITDNGTGDYSVNFTTALADSNYSVQALTCIESGETDCRIIGVNLNRSFNTLTCSVSTFNSFATKQDRTQVYVSVFD